MKAVFKFSSLTVIFLGLCVSLAFAQTYDLELEMTSNGSTVQTEFNPGETIYLNINLKNTTGAENIAGCAFTLEYPSSVLEAPELNTTEGLPVNSDLITSSFPFTFQTTTKTHRIGAATTDTAGKDLLLFSGAAIETDDQQANAGGAIDHDPEATLFTVQLVVKSGAPSGSYPFTLKTTTLNGVGGWTGQTVPVLIGAEPRNSDYFEDFDCSDGNCAFPVLKETLNVSASFEVPLPPDCVKGDSQESGTITATDALKCYYAITDSAKQFSNWECICDVNCKSGPTSTDALIIYYNSGTSAPITGYGCE